MTRTDGVLWTISGLSLAGSAAFLIAACFTARRSKTPPPLTREEARNSIGSDRFVEAFPDLTPRERRFFDRTEISRHAEERREPARKDRPKRVTFGDMPLPDVLAGVDWKTAAFEGLASQFLNTLPTLGGLEIHQMMRALVRRLNQSEADLAVALKLAEGGAQSPVSQLMVTLLGRIQSEAAVDLLAKLAGGGQTAGRELAVWSLAQSGQEPYLDSDPALLAKNPRGILSEPAYAIRGRHAAVMLARLAGESDPDVLSSLIAIFSDAQAEPRSSSPPRHETDREAITRLTIGYALNNKDARVRHSALAALGGTKAEAAIAALAQAMTTDEVASNRARAALSLSNLPGNETILRAARTAGADPDETVREFAVGLLHGARWVGRENEVLGVVEEIYRRDASARVRWECVGKFGSFGTAGRLLLQDAASNDPDPEVRKLAVELLSRSP